MPEQPVVLITGASSGIGAAAARLFANNGYAVILAARSLENLDTLADEIETAGGRAIAVRTDITQIEDIENLVSVSLSEFGSIDLLINNAGIGHLDWLENLDTSTGIDDQIRTNLVGLILVTRAVLPHMVARKKGHIINVASISSLMGTPTYSVYAASKFGVRGFSEALRREVQVWGIAISVIYPGSVKNEFGIRAGIKRKTSLSTPTRLKLSSEEVAKALLQLARHPRRSLVIPAAMLAPVWLNALAPGLIDWVIQKRFVEHERQSGKK
jgi:short-subunit dehydrogenase